MTKSLIESKSNETLSLVTRQVSPSDFRRIPLIAVHRQLTRSGVAVSLPQDEGRGEGWGGRGFLWKPGWRAHVRNQSRQLVSAGPKKVEEDKEVEEDASRIEFDGRRRRRKVEEEEEEEGRRMEEEVVERGMCVRVTA